MQAMRWHTKVADACPASPTEQSQRYLMIVIVIVIVVVIVVVVATS